MDEDDLGPWLRRKDSQVSADPSPSRSVFVVRKPSPLSSERHKLIRRTRDASHNSKLEYYRKGGSEAPVRPMAPHIPSVWIPRAKLQARTPDQTETTIRPHRKLQIGRRTSTKAEPDLRDSRSYADLSGLLEQRNPPDIFHKTRDLCQLVNLSPKPPTHFPPLVKSYRRRTPLRWERAGRWLEDLHNSHPYRPPSRPDLLQFLQSRQMSPRP
jgi:hypothetical protein